MKLLKYLTMVIILPLESILIGMCLKWGAFELVRHHPNDVFSEYQPLMPKKYYRRCITTTNLLNEPISTDRSITDCTINVQNVTVTNNAKLTINYGDKLTINGTFKV